MSKNKISVKEAKHLYFIAFPRPEQCTVDWSAVKSGHSLKIYHNDKLIDQVLVRYDYKIFRNYVQVHPEVES